MRIAILTRPDFRSPRVLADSLKLQLEKEEVQVEIFDSINILNRMVSFRNSKLSFHFWLKRKLINYFSDWTKIKKLKNFDAIVVSECAPNGFFKQLYNVEKLKERVKKPIGFYEVYYLGNAPTQIQFLEKNNEPLLDRYDFHLSISNVTEIKGTDSNNWYPIGIKGESWNLKPLQKKEIIAIIDFEFPGNEKIRKIQINALNKAGIKYISLESSYTIIEIRKIYQQGAIYFMQSFEAFGLPILECLCSGCQIFTQESWWPMSWRINANPQIHGGGTLPECFTVYHNEEQLVKELKAFKDNYDLVVSPSKIFEIFLAHYPNFFLGNNAEMKRLIYCLKNHFR